VRTPALLPWERLLWSGRPLRLGRRLSGERYVLTDVRLVSADRNGGEELALADIGEITRTESSVERLLGRSTLVVHGTRGGAPIVLTSIRKGAQLSAVLELLATDPRAGADHDTIRASLIWEPRGPALYREAAGAIVAVVIAILAVAFGLRGHAVTVTFSPDDAIAPDGAKRSRAEIVRFMETEVMPWAKTALGRIKGGPEGITCRTCHGAEAESRDWQMPGVAALPEPELKERGWETYSTRMDAQMRNAIYGYAAESEKSAKAGYMREVVVPGMAAVLRRPAYDFTKSYAYNRAQNAIGCYHCHRVQ